MEYCVGVSSGQDLLSLKSEDSNTILLPGKKKNKKGMNTFSRKQKTKGDAELSKSQRKKLKKLQEDKEKELLLSESIKTLFKYKIGEDAHSLMWSTRNLGQVETVREKRLREVRFSKAGLEFPINDRPIKRKVGGSNCEIESDSKMVKSRRRCTRDDSSCHVMGEIEVLHDISAIGSCVGFVNGSEASPSVKETSYEKNEMSMLGDLENSLSISNCYATEMEKPMDRINEYPKGNLSITSNLADSPPWRALSAPILVHVSRPKELENKRKDLPIVMMEQEIMEAINDNVSVIICGETGCGKTTQVPQFLYEAGFGSSQCSMYSGMIGVTQPRRFAVLATAKRVALELGLCLGGEVGFQVRHDKRIGDNCSIKFMTDGILLRELQNDFLLKRYSIIILDEAHERSLNTDILIGMLSRIIKIRLKMYEEQKHDILSGKIIRPEDKIFPLKLVLMSATLRVEEFVSDRRIFCDPPPIIEVPTRQYPVTVHFSKKTETLDYVGQAYKKVLSIHKKLPSGGILVFVTGQGEIENLCRKLCKASRKMVAKSSRQINDLSAVSEWNPVVDHNINKINEAFEILGNSSHQQTDRFSLFDCDHSYLAEDEPDYSFDSNEDSDLDDSDEDSDLEVFSDVGDLFNQKNLDSDGELTNVLRKDGNLASLRAAFEALARENTLQPDSEGKEVGRVTLRGSDRSNPSLCNNMEKAEGPKVSAMCVLPLYAMLPASAQLRVFDEMKDGERLVVVATNVAETSVTIPGIKYVVDTGREKVKVYNSSNGMETYEVQWISKASAAQRAGRAGRTGPGHCYRLYSSAVFSNIFSDFSSAKILKIPVDGVVLLMKSMGIDKVANFPFPTPPEVTAIVEAERCLKILEALDNDGRLTPLGKAMAQYPMSPRHSRMLLTVIQILKRDKSYSRPNLVLGYTVAAAAALSVSITRVEGNYTDSNGLNYDETSCSTDSKKDVDTEEKAKTDKASRAKILSPTSDALTIAYALHYFELSGDTMGLHLETMVEMSKLRNQILELVFHQSSCESQQDFSWTHGTLEDVKCAWKVSKHYLLPNEEDLVGQAICAGWADRVAKRTIRYSSSSNGDRKVNAVRYQACMVKETVFLHRRSSLSKFAPEYLVYSELQNTKRPYIHGATRVKEKWLVKYASSLCTFSRTDADHESCYDIFADRVFCKTTPTFGPHLWHFQRINFPIKDGSRRVAVFAYSLLTGKVLPCLCSANKFLAAAPAIILRPESSGQKRVGNLIYKLMTRSRVIDSCAMLREAWDENPGELYPEIQDWFQKEFHNQFEELWAKMHFQVRLHPQERLAMRGMSRKILLYEG